MKEEIKKLARKIKRLSKEYNLTEIEIATQLKKQVEAQQYDAYIKLYRKRKKPVKMICDDLGISTKKFYRVLRLNDVEIQKRKPTKKKVK